MELLKALFESAELPAEFKEKTTTLFEAAVNERLAAEIVTIQEASDKKLEESKAAFIAEATATIDAVVEETVLEWAKENAVALDSEIKGQIAESFLQGLKGIFEKADIELSGDTAGQEMVKLQEQNAELAKQAEAAQTALAEAQDKLVQIQVKDILAEVTAGLADTQVHRVSKLVEAFEFKSAEDFRAKASLVVEAVTGAPLKQEAKGSTQPGKEFNGEGQGNGGDVATGYTAKGSAGSVKGTVDADGVQIPVDGKGHVSNTVDTAAGTHAAEDGELVKKPAGNSVTSAEGAKGTPVQKESTDLIEAAAPHLHADLIAETLKLFK